MCSSAYVQACTHARIVFWSLRFPGAIFWSCAQATGPADLPTEGTCHIVPYRAMVSACLRTHCLLPSSTGWEFWSEENDMWQPSRLVFRVREVGGLGVCVCVRTWACLGSCQLAGADPGRGQTAKQGLVPFNLRAELRQPFSLQARIGPGRPGEQPAKAANAFVFACVRVFISIFSRTYIRKFGIASCPPKAFVVVCVCVRACVHLYFETYVRKLGLASQPFNL